MAHAPDPAGADLLGPMTGTGPLGVPLPPLPRARGAVRLKVGHERGATRVTERFEEGCLRLRLLRRHGPAAEAVIVNVGGGLAGGDEIGCSIKATVGAELTVTSAAAEKVYRATGETARVSVRLEVEDARLAWLPQETILFDGARLERRFTVDVAGPAVVAAVESVVLGRTARGERGESVRFRDSWDLRRNGRLVFADRTHLDGDVGARTAPCGLGDAVAFATLLLVAPDAGERIAPLREVLGGSDGGIEGGASVVDGVLIGRLVASHGHGMRSALARILPILTGCPTLPRIWSC